MCVCVSTAFNQLCTDKINNDRYARYGKCNLDDDTIGHAKKRRHSNKSNLSHISDSHIGDSHKSNSTSTDNTSVQAAPFTPLGQFDNSDVPSITADIPAVPNAEPKKRGRPAATK